MDRLTEYRLAKSRRRIGPYFSRNVFALLFVLLHTGLYLSPIGQQLEPKILNFPSVRSWIASSPDEVVIVAIDERSYQLLGLSFLEPWPRKQYAALLRQLKSYQSRAVIFDIVFSSIGADPFVDQELADGLKLLPSFIGEYVVQSRMYDPIESKQRQETNYVHSLELFQKSARGSVSLNAPIDFGVWRRFSMVSTPDGRQIPAMADAVMSFNGVIEALPDNQDFIRFYGPPGVIKTVSIADVIQDDERALSSVFKDKIVLVGTKLLADAGIAQKDTFITSASNRAMAGVEAHATVVINLLRREWIRRATPSSELLLLNMLTFLFVIILSGLRPGAAFKTISLAILGWFISATLGIYSGVFIPGFILFFIVLPLTLFFVVFRNYGIFKQSFQQMSDAMGVTLHLKK